MDKIRNDVSAIVLALGMVWAGGASAQVVDEVIAVTGNEIVLYSDVRMQMNQLKAQGYKANLDECTVLEDILTEKLMLNQAKVDSLEVTDAAVEIELGRRMEVFIRQIGSVEALEAYYQKSMEEIREDFFEVLKDQMLVRRMQGEVTADVNVTPADVENFYNSIPADSLPYINASVEMAQIVKYPEVSREEIERIRERLRSFKQQVEAGEYDFETLAALYSEDPGSAAKGGSLGMKPRGTFVPEFDAVAYSLKEGDISAPFKTDFGYHIMQMVEMRGEMYEANHILLVPKTSTNALHRARTQLDTIRAYVTADTLSFAFAANKYSDDERTRNQNGIIVNLSTGSTLFEIDELDPTLFLAIDTLEAGEITQPFFFQNPATQQKGYRIVKLLRRTQPHRANPVDDYAYLQEAATQAMSNQEVERWLRETIGSSYVRIDERYHGCAFKLPWLKEVDTKAEAKE